MSRRTNQVVAPGCGGVPAPPQVHFGKSDVQITSIGSVGTTVNDVCKRFHLRDMFTCFYKGNYIKFPQNVIIATPTLQKPDNCYTNFQNLGIFEVVYRFVRENPDLRCD